MNRELPRNCIMNFQAEPYCFLSTGQEKNHLGRILMKVREELKTVDNNYRERTNER